MERMGKPGAGTEQFLASDAVEILGQPEELGTQVTFAEIESTSVDEAMLGGDGAKTDTQRMSWRNEE
jgi:hypothetical protein